MNPSTRSPVLYALILMATSGCTVGPEYVPPDLDVGEGWSTEAVESSTEPVAVESVAVESPAAPGSSPSPGPWWTVFGDATLDRLVGTALAENLDLRTAAARIAEASATRDWTEGRRRPTVDADGRVDERRQSENGTLPIDRIPDLERDQTVFDVGVGLSWEPDIVGRTRRALEAAEARLHSAEAERRAARLAVASAVTRTYLTLRTGQRELDAAEAAVDAARHTAELVALRVEAGEDPAVELARIEAELRTLESRLPGLRSTVRAQALALGPLTGGLPEAELPLLDTPPPPLGLAPLPVGERAEILRRRADVLIAERQLAAATADIGLATAELYPRLSIGARGGFQALDLGDLVDGSSVTWSIVPAITWRLLDGGRVRAEIRIAEARAEAAALGWESTVLDALAEAEVALARYRADLEALDLEHDARDAARTVRDLERARHRAGDVPLLTLLDAERRLEETEASVAATQGRAADGLVSLIQALGGGWG